MALIAILASVSIALMSTSSYASTAKGFANEIVAEADTTRMRAVATRRWQRMSVLADRIVVSQATTEGMAAPTSWEVIQQVIAPGKIRVDSFDNTTHLVAGSSVPAAGANLPGSIDFAPDGSAQAGTIFITDFNEQTKVRVIFYRASGSAYVRGQW